MQGHTQWWEIKLMTSVLSGLLAQGLACKVLLILHGFSELLRKPLRQEPKVQPKKQWGAGPLLWQHRLTSLLTELRRKQKNTQNDGPLESPWHFMNRLPLLQTMKRRQQHTSGDQSMPLQKQPK